MASIMDGRESLLGTGQHEGRSFTWQQAQLIAGQKQMGGTLAVQLKELPELRNELSDQVHNTSLGYEGVLRQHFFESGRDLGSLLDSPFITAFETTSQCTEEEKVFLAQLRKTASGGTNPAIDSIENFQEWFNTRLGFLAKGFQMCVLYSGVIESLTLEEAANKTSEGGKLWRERNPDRSAENMKKARGAAAEAAQPHVFKDAVRKQIQTWFERGFDYETVRLLLKGVGVETSISSLKQAVHSYEDLHYTPKEIRERQRKAFSEAARDIFEATKSRRETMEILEKLGHSPRKTDLALHNLGLREKTDWTKSVEIEGQTRRLEDLVLDFMAGNYPRVKDEYKAFTSYLQSNGVNIAISEKAYDGVRRKIKGTQVTT